MVLMLLSDPLRALAELARVLKPGASLAFVVGRVGRAHGILEFAAAKTAELLASEEKPLPQLDPRFATIEGLSGLPWGDLGFDGAAVATIELSRRLSMEQLTSYVSGMYGP